MTRPRLLFLGSPRIEIDGATLEVDTRKAVALLAYLALTRRPHARDSLVGLLWPDHGQKRARAALRRTLSSLARAREAGWLEIQGDTVNLRSDETWVDVDRFRELLAECASHGHPESEACPSCLSPLTEAVSLYRDDFLAGFGLRDSFAFDDWQYFQAEELRRELAGALEKLARGHGAAGEWEAAIAHARRRLLLDPLHEPAHRALMQLYALSGERASALRQYRECVRVLEKDLGVAPLEETTSLYRAVQEGAAVPPFPATGTATERPAPSDMPRSEGKVSDPAGSPLLGRDQEWAALEKAYAAASEGMVVALEGEAGIGKTRLAEEFLARARERGASVLSARCFRGETDLAYGPFVEAFGTVAQREHLSARLSQAPPEAIAEAARLLPALAGTLPETPSLPPLDTPGARSRFYDGVFRTLLAALEGTPTGGAPPGILFVDDLQWADEASLDLLNYLARRLGGHPLLVISAWREALVPEDHRLRGLLPGAEDSVTLLRLSRLDEAAVEELASRGGAPPGLGGRLYRETEGLPLFLAEYLAAISSGDLDPGGEAWPLPGGVQSLLRSRLRTPGETGGQLLAAAAVIGRSFDFDTVREASGRGEEEAVTALEGLISHRLIREVPNESGGGSPLYDFSHDKLRALAYEETSLARKRLLHRRVAGTLAARARRKEAGPLAAQIAHHYRLAGKDDEAAEHYRLAGEHARDLSAHAEALSHLRTALALGHHDTAGLHEAIGDLHTLRGEYGAAAASYETTAARLEGPELAGIERKLGDVHARRGDWEMAEGHYRTALEELEGASHEAERALLYADMSLNSHHRDRPEEAEELAARALDLAETMNEPRALARAHNAAGMLARSREDWDAARQHLERSLTLAEALGDPDARVAALNNLALAHAAAGDTEQAIRETEAALPLCVATGDRHREAALRNNLADLFHAAGQPEKSMSQLKIAVEIFAEVGEEETMQPGIWKLTEW
jgi:predicted ATPase